LAQELVTELVELEVLVVVVVKVLVVVVRGCRLRIRT
jgi:hypothetical protein